MSIISWLFSKNTESNSLVRKWVALESKKVDHTNPDVYALFVGLIETAVQCGKYNAEEQDQQLLQAAKQFLGDATIFEIVCYSYCRVENWLEKNQPELTSEITRPIRQWIVEKFHTALYVDESWISQLFDEQLVRYKTLRGAGQGIEEMQLELEQKIAMTKGDKFDKTQLAKPPTVTALDSQYIKLSLSKYEEMHVTALLATFEEYCKNNTKKQMSQNKNKNQKLDQNQGHRDYLYGLALLEQQDWVRACNAFSKVLSNNPKHYEALIQRGLLYTTLHQYVDALQDFDTAIEVNSNESIAYLYRGKCYHKNLRQKDKALADYTEAIRLAPSSGAAYFARGELYDEIVLQHEKQVIETSDHTNDVPISKEFSAAIHDYSQVIALEPEHDAAYANRGLVYARKARLNPNEDVIVKSIADLEKAMTLNWEHGHLYKQQEELKELLVQISEEGQAV